MEMIEYYTQRLENIKINRDKISIIKHTVDGLSKGEWLFEANDLKTKVEEFTNHLSTGPTFAYGKIKSLLDSATKNNFLAQLQQEKEAGLLCGRTEDGKEAIKASIEKRKPKFVGK